MSSTRIEPESFLHDGPLPATRVAEILERWGGDGHPGAVVTFAGLVRADHTNEGRVEAIEFSAHEHMATTAIRELLERILAEPPERGGAPVYAVHVEHAIGTVPVGAIPIVIAVAAKHRSAAFETSEKILEALKREVPIYGKELCEGEAHRWKVNR